MPQAAGTAAARFHGRVPELDSSAQSRLPVLRGVAVAHGADANDIVGSTRWTAWLRAPFMRVSSELSYCIYLVHLSIYDGYQWLLTAPHLEPARLFGPLGALLCQIFCVLAVTLALAAVSKRYLEDPCLRLKRFFEEGARPERRRTIGLRPVVPDPLRTLA
jgi:peptidoglycan/LPS O-acetylase OafA/YrhL